MDNEKRSEPVRSAGFTFENIGAMKRAFAAEKAHPRAPEAYIYSRYRNPTVVSAESRLMEIEGCGFALLTQSGMAAIDLALTLFQRGSRTGPWLFFRDIYGGTNSYVDTVLVPRRGVRVERFEARDERFDLDRFSALLDEVRPELLFFEGVSNPMLIVADGGSIIASAKSRGAVVIVDNTFATPWLWRPLDQGADLVIHSATKYLGGHNDLTAGVVCGNDLGLMRAAVECRKWIGHMLGPDDALRLESRLDSFPDRFDRHCANALSLARALDKHDKVERVLYPGLPSHPTHQEAAKLFDKKGYGGVVTFDLAGADREAKGRACECFVASLSHAVPLVPTLGDVRTTLLPIEAVWGEKYPHPGMIRLSVGIEPIETLERTILDALNGLP